MSSRINGYVSEREYRPSSEQMSDLHVYLVPQNIWRDKFNNALNQYIDDTISLGFIRVHPELRVSALRDEIEQQLGAEVIPREYVFVKSVGRSLTRLKGRQENTLKVKNFLPPQAYAPELYLLEATPEVKQAYSDSSTRPETRTSYDYDLQRQSDASLQHAKYSNTPNGPGYQYPLSPSRRSGPGPYLPPRSLSPRRQASPTRSQPRTERSSPSVAKTMARPEEPRSVSHRQSDSSSQNINRLSVDWEESDNNYDSDQSRYANNPDTALNNRNRPPRDLRNTSASDPSLDPSQHQMVSSSRRAPPTHGKPGDPDRLPLSATPPHSGSEKTRAGHRGGGGGGNQHKHDEDSGIAGFTPETYRENNVLDRRKSGSADRLKPASPVKDDSDRLNRSDNDDWERRQQEEEEERGRREEEERRRREEEERRRKEEEEQRRQRDGDDAKLTKTSSEEDLTRYPSPPPLRLASPDRDTASARAQRKKEKEELLKELEQAREGRKASERQREDLVKQAKMMQSKTQSRRNHARDLWKKRYFEEKKKTGPLEEQCNRLRHELDIFHKKLLTTLEGPKEKATKLSDLKHSNKYYRHFDREWQSYRKMNNFKIQATRLQHEIEDIRQRVDHAKMKLTSEMKLRNQAETELRALRAELMQKKINLTLSRNSQLTTYAPPAADVPMYSNRSGITPRS